MSCVSHYVHFLFQIYNPSEDEKDPSTMFTLKFKGQDIDKFQLLSSNGNQIQFDNNGHYNTTNNGVQPQYFFPYKIRKITSV